MNQDRAMLPTKFCQTAVSRRHVLRVGMLGLGGLGLSLADLLAAERAPEVRPTADACILLFLDGGPSHLDMWDMKPEAPDGIRGEFKPISTSLPGYFVCEHLPRLARHMHRATVVRSMHHSVNNSHGAAVYTALTGHDRGEAGGSASASDYPCLGAVVQRLRPPATADTVSQVHLPYITKEGAGGPPQPGFFGGIFGRAYDPLFVLKDPSAPDFSVPELTVQADVSAARLAQRRSLFERVDAGPATLEGQLAAGEMTRMQQRALDLLTSERTQRAFRLADESDPTRESYGRNIYGQSALLARRLIEAGTRVVTLSWAPDANATWDTHGSNFISLRDRLLPQLDAAASSLIGDLAERGMLDRTLVAIFGDFGRTPKINGNNGGRDHWNFCYSLMMVGGGFKRGLVYGASDKIGAYPATDPLTPGDMLSTIYHTLGIRHDREIHDQFGRPLRLVPTGDVIAELLEG
ncbi:MAG TPA: DUF1501 domain-containing protein [Pirellulales bacterium]|nr:DUF1501 domain-containing protein [Pirellulales bacterium]